MDSRVSGIDSRVKSPLIKICGITNLEDACVCAEAGADMLGFNFYQRSLRYIPPGKAQEIIDKLPPQILTIGVFVNAGSPAKVREMLATSGVIGVQFHGDETPDYCREFNDRFVIKALRVTPEFEPARADDYEVSAIMLDAFDSNVRGGTGHSFDWSIALEVREHASRLFLAGGLSSQNVRTAITTVRPYAIDVCSSLETVPGKKDSARVWNFIKVARNMF